MDTGTTVLHMSLINFRRDTDCSKGSLRKETERIACSMFLELSHSLRVYAVCSVFVLQSLEVQFPHNTLKRPNNFDDECQPS